MSRKAEELQMSLHVPYTLDGFTKKQQQDAAIVTPPSTTEQRAETLRMILQKKAGSPQMLARVQVELRCLTDETFRMYVANCRCCTLASAMKNCAACKFNVGLDA